MIPTKPYKGDCRTIANSVHHYPTEAGYLLGFPMLIERDFALSWWPPGWQTHFLRKDGRIRLLSWTNSKSDWRHEIMPTGPTWYIYIYMTCILTEKRALTELYSNRKLTVWHCLSIDLDVDLFSPTFRSLSCRFSPNHSNSAPVSSWTGGLQDQLWLTTNYARKVYLSSF